MSTLEGQGHAARRAEGWDKQRAYFNVVALRQKRTLQRLRSERCLFFKTTGCLTASVQKSIQKIHCVSERLGFREWIGLNCTAL